MPVTATTGRPALSRCALAVGRVEAMTALPQFDPFEQREPFAAPIADAGDDDLGQAGRTFADIAAPGRGEQLAMLEHRAADAQIGRELGIDPMPDIRTGIADGKADLLEHAQLRRSRRLEPGGAGNDRGMGAVDLRGDRLPLPAQRRFDVARLARDCGRNNTCEIRARGRAPRALRMLAAFQHQKRAHGRERDAALRAAIPDRRELALEHRARRARTRTARPSARRDRRRRPASVRSGRRRCAPARRARRRRRPASSPMKVREEPTTPCTSEILPASRFGSCARNSVGRRSLISRSLRKAPGSSALRMPAMIAVSTAMSRSPPPAATIMSVWSSSSGLPAMPASVSARPAE